LKYSFGNREYDFNSRTFIMGVLNITPDSFSDGGKYFDGKVLINKVIGDAVRMESEGADFLDVGGESTRPGSEEISIDEEISRVVPVISELKKKVNIPISIDTYKHEVAEEALKAGAEIVNDISGFKFDIENAEVTAEYDASCILMHIKGTPKNMQDNPEYEDVVKEVRDYLKESADIARSFGISRIITDPGIGFGKTLNHNLDLIRNISKIRELGYPVMIGASRKSFIDKIYPAPVSERLPGTISANIAGILNGANIIRVHDIKENKSAAVIADKIFKI